MKKSKPVERKVLLARIESSKQGLFLDVFDDGTYRGNGTLFFSPDVYSRWKVEDGLFMWKHDHMDDYSIGDSNVSERQARDRVCSLGKVFALLGRVTSF